MMKKLIEMIVHAVVDYPEQAEVTVMEGSKTNVVCIRVAEKDMRFIVGRDGRIAEAIRTIVINVSSKEGKSSIFEVII